MFLYLAHVAASRSACVFVCMHPEWGALLRRTRTCSAGAARQRTAATLRGCGRPTRSTPAPRSRAASATAVRPRGARDAAFLAVVPSCGSTVQLVMLSVLPLNSVQPGLERFVNQRWPQQPMCVLVRLLLVIQCSWTLTWLHGDVVQCPDHNIACRGGNSLAKMLWLHAQRRSGWAWWRSRRSCRGN